MKKYLPKIGDQLYLRQFTNDMFVDAVKIPYTVIEVSPNQVTVQKCKLIAPIYHNPQDPRDGQRIFFYNTIAESIEPDPEGPVTILSWHPSRRMWGSLGVKDSDYPLYAVFGKYEHFSYLN